MHDSRPGLALISVLHHSTATCHCYCTRTCTSFQFSQFLVHELCAKIPVLTTAFCSSYMVSCINPSFVSTCIPALLIGQDRLSALHSHLLPVTIPDLPPLPTPAAAGLRALALDAGYAGICNGWACIRPRRFAPYCTRVGMNHSFTCVFS